MTFNAIGTVKGGAILTLCWLMLTPSLAAQTEFVGTNGDDWHDPDNWSAGLPDSELDALVPSGASVTISQDVVVNAFTLQNQGELIVAGELVVEECGSVLNQGVMTLNEESFLWMYGTFENEGELEVYSTDVLVQSSFGIEPCDTALFTNSGFVENYGHIGFDDAIFENSGEWSNAWLDGGLEAIGGSLVNYPEGTITNQGWLWTQLILQNHGTIHNEGNWQSWGLVNWGAVYNHGESADWYNNDTGESVVNEEGGVIINEFGGYVFVAETLTNSGSILNYNEMSIFEPLINLNSIENSGQINVSSMFTNTDGYVSNLGAINCCFGQWVGPLPDGNAPILPDGCTDPLSCNYDPAALCDDGSCSEDIAGCTDGMACNFDESASCENGSCWYPEEVYLDCEGECLSDSDGDGICDELELAGCTDPDACNYDPGAMEDDGGCEYPSVELIVGNQNPAAYTQSVYYCMNTPGSEYVWEVEGGIVVDGQGSSTATILWADAGPGQLQVTEVMESNCEGSVTLTVTIVCPMTMTAIQGPATPGEQVQIAYSCDGEAASSYQWSMVNGVVIAGQGTPEVTVVWASIGLGSITVVETSGLDCVAGELSMDVVVMPATVVQEEQSMEFQLHPNPATDRLVVTVEASLVNGRFGILTTDGRRVGQGVIQDQRTVLDVAGLRAGHYVFELQVDGERVRRPLVIKR